MTLSELIKKLVLLEDDYGEYPVKIYDPYLGEYKHIESISTGCYGVYVEVEE